MRKSYSELGMNQSLLRSFVYQQMAAHRCRRASLGEPALPKPCFHSNAGSAGLCTFIGCAGQTKPVYCLLSMVTAFV